MVLVRGIRESAETNNVMVLLKIAAILLFIGVGAHYIHPTNWKPFYPNGWSGVLTGGSIIFFTYIGFDSVSTAAEECKNPQRDVPIGIIATLIVCTFSTSESRSSSPASSSGPHWSTMPLPSSTLSRRSTSRIPAPRSTGLAWPSSSARCWG